MGRGVEWALHCCVNLAWAGSPVPTVRLAGLYGLPAAYLNKQLQALVRAGVLVSVPGPRGGFALERDPSQVTLLDVVVALEGPEDAFRCTSILAAGPDGDPARDYADSCAISLSMRGAELAWRRELAARSLADVATDALRYSPDAADRVRNALTS
ncbi:BadM/Rrf2 family transcriptional regulator [Pseudonocardia autotrophica]|uniref:Iron-responsive transcriptional regulator n=3 Tax=Pseudonocardiaceae TaxID=2070 RepID=A0A1Y2MXH5_PSEAH|nr:iron-responsive transcriptional regulator [Pseudonocardia autotrophica]TDN74469.1 BadM/Rrf2 family transcriptional regulator [Pseudonocardia autotrophica]BBG05236.1 transcriptional regulator [Pseudonocardia autotrophica]GEC25756.1 transcriptional regulator [Pseudonocardia saturnea]